MSMSNQYFKLN